MMRSNPVKQKLAAGGIAYGTMVFEFNSPGLPAALVAAGAEFALYDMEHSGFTMAEMKQQFAYCRGIGLVPIVRPPAKTYSIVATLLDIGAMGLMFQMVESAEEAGELVRWTRYPPRGQRGAMFGGAHDDYAAGDVAQKLRGADERTFVLAMIETRKGAENLESILAVDGIDGGHLGQFDLSLSLGIPAQFDRPEIQTTIDRLTATCKRLGKTAACMAPTLETALDWQRRGFRMMSYRYDTGLMQDALNTGICTLKAQEGLRIP
jgi:2-dehydro-3-deoxyglucarate aldolase/4-hydroxy-2-oxoheptanedioate aldolase